MVLNFKEVRAGLLRRPHYMGKPAEHFKSFAWKILDRAHVLVPTRGSDALHDAAVLVAFGSVARGGDALGPSGTWSEKRGDLAEAKWTLTLDAPEDEALFNDWQNMRALIYGWTKKIAKTGSVQTPFDGDDADSGLNCKLRLFNRTKSAKEAIIEPPKNYSNDPKSELYFATDANWPIPGVLEAEFRKLSDAHKFQPLRVYNAKGVAINPSKYKATLLGSMVEVHFKLFHHRIKNSNSPGFTDFISTHIVKIKLVEKSSSKRRISKVTEDNDDDDLPAAFDDFRKTNDSDHPTKKARRGSEPRDSAEEADGAAGSGNEYDSDAGSTANSTRVLANASNSAYDDNRGERSSKGKGRMFDNDV
ncbi:hypothetical protein ONZ45_g6682 [Pleurotus djamor]|nr:hypothetical protein ONZ45_g6682 [Pleurotus djamor]